MKKIFENWKTIQDAFQQKLPIGKFKGVWEKAISPKEMTETMMTNYIEHQSFHLGSKNFYVEVEA